MSYQINMTIPNSEWVTPSEFPDLSHEDEIAIDLETRDENMKTLGTGWARRDGEIVGIAVAAGSFKGYYPVNHQGGGNLPRSKVFKWIQEVLKTDAAKIMHNAQYDLGWIRSMGWEVKGPIIDTMVTAALVDENRRSYSLNNLSIEMLGEMKSETELKEEAAQRGLDAKAELWKMPAMAVGFYAEQDAVLTLKLWHHLKTFVKKEQLQTIWNTEMELLPILIKMREVGIRIDLDKAEILKKQFKTLESSLITEIKKLSGVAVDIWAARSVAKAFDAVGIKYDLTEKSKAPSFTTNWLTNNEHPLAKLIREAREVNKLHSTFIDSFLRFSHKGRIHAEINQLRSDTGGTVSGRLSYSNPNLQQIPARNKEYGKLIRGLFLPEEGCKWGSFDYSQQEPRLVVHYAATTDKKLGGLAGADVLIKAYREDDADFHQVVADMANIPRTQAKTINLGIVQKQASETGAVKTIGGRKCRFNLYEPKSYGLFLALTEKEYIMEHGSLSSARRAMTYKALNRLIQGSAADQVKIAMVNCYKAGHIPMLQIHDELCFNIESESDEKNIINVMENSVELEVPNKVDVSIGDNWGEAM
jgi:DNA polymerase I-like protein with 3'-5' exonuclease and polymerase domains